MIAGNTQYILQFLCAQEVIITQFMRHLRSDDLPVQLAAVKFLQELSNTPGLPLPLKQSFFQQLIKAGLLDQLARYLALKPSELCGPYDGAQARGSSSSEEYHSTPLRECSQAESHGVRNKINAMEEQKEGKDRCWLFNTQLRTIKGADANADPKQNPLAEPTSNPWAARPAMEGSVTTLGFRAETGSEPRSNFKSGSESESGSGSGPVFGGAVRTEGPTGRRSSMYRDTPGSRPQLDLLQLLSAELLGDGLRTCRCIR